MSSDFEPLDDGLTAFASAFGALQPSAIPLNRDRILFEAGQASVRAGRSRHLWPALAASLALVAAGEAALLARGPTTHTIERIVVIREPAPSPTPAPVVAAAELTPVRPSLAWDGPRVIQTPRDRLVDQVLRYGLDGLPPLVARDVPAEPPLRPSRLWPEPGDPS